MLRMTWSRDDRGAAAIEYALLGAVVGLGIVAGLVASKRSLNTNYDKITYQLGAAVPAVAAPPRVVASTSTYAYSLNGTVLTQKSTFYTDGTRSMVQTNSNPAAVGYGDVDYEFDAAGNTISSYVRNPDGTFQYSEVIKPLRPGTNVHTLTTAAGASYSYSRTSTTAGALTTLDSTMLDAGGLTGMWTAQRVVVDSSNPGNVTTKVTCQYGSGPYGAC